MRFTVLLLLCIFIISGECNQEVVLPLPDSPPPCQSALNVTSQCSQPDKWGYPDCSCTGPFPFTWLPENKAIGACANGVWTLNEDVLVPADTLVDICKAVVQVNGNFILPPSSNMSLYRVAPVEEQPTMVQELLSEGQLRVSGHLLQFGRLMLVIANGNADQEPAQSDPPADGATFVSLTTHQDAQLSGKYELWQEYDHKWYNFIVCQTIKFTVSDPTGTSQALKLSVFNQCDYDIRIFVIVMGTVGGAIVVFSIIYLIYVIVSGIRASMHEPPQRDYDIKDYDL